MTPESNWDTIRFGPDIHSPTAKFKLSCYSPCSHPKSTIGTFNLFTVLLVNAPVGKKVVLKKNVLSWTYEMRAKRAGSYRPERNWHSFLCFHCDPRLFPHPPSMVNLMCTIKMPVVELAETLNKQDLWSLTLYYIVWADIFDQLFLSAFEGVLT